MGNVDLNKNVVAPTRNFNLRLRRNEGEGGASGETYFRSHFESPDIEDSQKKRPRRLPIQFSSSAMARVIRIRQADANRGPR